MNAYSDRCISTSRSVVNINARLILLYVWAAVFAPMFYFGEFPLAMYQLVFLILLFWAVVVSLVRARSTIVVPSFMRLFVLLIFAYALSAMTNLLEHDYTAHPRDLVVVFASMQYFVLVCLVATYVANTNVNVNWLARKLLATNALILLLVGLVSVCQMMDLFNAQALLAEYYGKTDVEAWRQYFLRQPRASATFNLQSNTLGMFSSIALLNVHMFAKESGLPKVLSATCYLFGLVGLILSGSFTGLVVLIFVSFAYLFLYRKIGIKTLLVISLVAFSTYSIFQSEIDASLDRQKMSSEQLVPSSFRSRMDNYWTRAVAAIAKEPMNGVGPGVAVIDFPADNDYLDKLMRFGVVGGGAFLLWVASLIAIPLVLRSRALEALPRKLFLFSALSAVALALASITGSAFNAPRLAEYFWVFYLLPFLMKQGNVVDSLASVPARSDQFHRIDDNLATAHPVESA